MLFQSYEYFLEIVASGSLSRAAEKLFVTQPALSKYVKRLEERIGAPLFIRNGTTLKLTHLGEHYYHAALEMKKIENTFKNDLYDLVKSQHSFVSLGISRWRSAFVLTKFLSVFQVEYPKIEIGIDVENSKIIISELTTGRIDIGIVSQGTGNVPDTLYSTKLFDEKMLLAANINHPIIEKMISSGDFTDYDLSHHQYPVVDFHTLTNESFLVLDRDTADTRQIMNFFDSFSLNIKIAKRLHNVNSLIFGVATSLSFAFIPETGINVNAIPDEVVFLSMGDATLTTPVVAMTRHFPGEQPQIDAALNTLINVFSK